MSSSTESTNNIIACIIAIGILAASYIYMFGRRGEVVNADNVSRVMASTNNADNADNKGGDITTTTALKENNITTCAACGKKGVGDLKFCDACKLVKYCNRDCQVAHRPQHKKTCKKRAVELHDEALFKDPLPPEDCPICFLPMPISQEQQLFKSCCGKVICDGCDFAGAAKDYERGKKKEDIGLCPFCRVPAPRSDEDVVERNRRLDEFWKCKFKCIICTCDVVCSWNYGDATRP